MPKNSSKIQTFTGIYKNDGNCLTLVELPQIFDHTDILSVTKSLKKRCWSNILIHLDALKWPKSTESKLLNSQMQLMHSVYGEKAVNSMCFMSENDSKVAETFPAFTEKVPLCSQKLGRKMNCLGSSCIKKSENFFKGANIWIYPNEIQVHQDTESVEINCFVHRENAEMNLYLKKDEDDWDSWDDEDPVPLTSDKISKFVDDMKVTTFTVKNPISKTGKYECQSEDGLLFSHYTVNLKQSQSRPPKWSLWSSWSKCSNVGVDKVSRTRQSPFASQIESQERYCRCSDLAEMPRPR